MLAALVWSPAASATAPTFNMTFDGSGTPDGSMTPMRLAVHEANGDIYVIDNANDVVNRFGIDGRYKSQLVGTDTTDRTFGFSGGDDAIAVDNTGGANDGNVYVVGEQGGGPGKVAAFDETGRFLWQTTFGSDTCGIAIDGAGRVWASDYIRGLQELDAATGATVGTPAFVTGDGCRAGFDASGGTVLVAGYNSSTKRYDMTGSELATIHGGNTDDFAVDPSNGDIYVLHRPNVYQYDASGAGISGSPFGIGVVSNSSFGIAVDGTNHKVYVARQDRRDVVVYDAVVRNALDVTVDGSLGGRVSDDGGGIVDCTSSTGACSTEYDSGSTVTLTATADDPGNTKVTWTGCDSVVGDDCIVTLTGDTRITTTFDPIPRYTLDVAKDGTGTGSVAGSPGTIACGATCSEIFEENTEITLTATADAGSTFAGWSGGGCSGTDPCRVTLTGDTTVTATFTKDAVPPPRTCATDPSLCPTPPPRTCETDPSLCPTPPPPVDEGELELDKRLAMVAGGKAAVKLSCVGDTACAGKVRLVAKVKVGGKKGKKKARKSRTKNVLVGRASVDISGGDSQTVKVRLTRTGKRLLARAKRGRLVATLVGPDLRERVVLKEKATKKSKRKKGKRARRRARS